MSEFKLSKHNTSLPLREEYDSQQRLLEAQPAIIARYLEAQGKQLADTLSRNLNHAHFSLPDRVVTEWVDGKPTAPTAIPAGQREQETGGVIDRLVGNQIRFVLHNRLVELEGSARKSVAVSASLIRFATAWHMVYAMLPSGRSVNYMAPEGEEISSIPVKESQVVESAITQASDAIVEEDGDETPRGELQVPFTAEARQFFLPQWVSFGTQGNLLVNNVNEAEAHLSSMIHYIEILHTAVGLAPYFVADPEYQKKRYGMLGQLVNQGRALACHQTEEMIRIIKQRGASHDLNRGLSLSLPYFDDQALRMQTRDFVVIPFGRIMFVPTFVIKATQEEEAKVAQDTRLSPSTRKYMLLELDMLKHAFQRN